MVRSVLAKSLQEGSRRERVEFKEAYRITAYLPTYPPHHKRFEKYLQARLKVEEIFYKFFGGVTTLEGDGVFYSGKGLFTEKTFIIYSYAPIKEEDAQRFIKGLFSELNMLVPEEEVILVTYQKVIEARSKKTTSDTRSIF